MGQIHGQGAGTAEGSFPCTEIDIEVPWHATFIFDIGGNIVYPSDSEAFDFYIVGYDWRPETVVDLDSVEMPPSCELTLSRLWQYEEILALTPSTQLGPIRVPAQDGGTVTVGKLEASLSLKTKDE